MTITNNENASVSQIISMVGMPTDHLQIVSKEGEIMARYPRAPQDYDSYLLNHWHGPLSKTQKLRVYKDALFLASQEIARLNGYLDGEFERCRYISKAVEVMKKEGI